MDYDQALSFLVEVWNRGAGKNKPSASAKLKTKQYEDVLKYTLRHVRMSEDSSYAPEDAMLTIFLEFFFLYHDNGDETIRFYYKRDDKKNWEDTLRSGGDYYSPIPIAASNFYDGTGTYPCAENLYDDGHAIGRDCLVLMKNKGLIPFIDDIFAGVDFNPNAIDDVYIARNFVIDPNTYVDVPDPFNVISNNEIEKLWNAIVTVVNKIASK